MYKKILVPFDSSPVSDRALDEAIRLARAMSARLRIVHAVNTRFPQLDQLEDIVDVNEVGARLEEAGRKLLAQAEQKARQAGVEAETRLHRTDGKRVVDVLGGDADAWGADLIVMGTHGRTGFDYLLLGSVAEEFLRVTPTPLLLVRGE